MKCFYVMAKDLFDKKKNPHFVLSAEKILKNRKIKKYPIKKEIKKYAKNMTKKELEKNIWRIEHSYGSRDVICFNLLYAEVKRRGYEIKTRVKLIS